MTHHLLSFTVPVLPLGWQRPGYVGHIYKPRRMRSYQAVIGMAARTAMRGRTIYAQALRVTISAIFPIPPSWSRAKRAAALAGEIAHTAKPDQDNVGKAILDAANAIIWLDDAQIVDCRVIKLWGADPLVRVEVAQAVSSRAQIVQELANRILRAGQLL